MVDLEVLISGLSRIHVYLASKESDSRSDKGVQTRNINQSNINLFCILPRGVLRNIFLCLNLKLDVPRIAATCKVFYTVTHSRAYHIGLYSQHHAREKAKHKLKDQSYTFAMGATRSNSRAFDEEDMSEQDTIRLLNSANATNSLLAEKMKLRDSKIDSMTQELDSLRHCLRYERLYSEEINKKHIASKREFDEYVQTHPDEQLKICYLTDQQSKERQSLKKQIEDWEKSALELRKHRSILRNEVKKLREETGNSAQQLLSRKQDVSRLKGLLSELPRIKSDLRD